MLVLETCPYSHLTDRQVRRSSDRNSKHLYRYNPCGFA